MTMSYQQLTVEKADQLIQFATESKIPFHIREGAPFGLVEVGLDWGNRDIASVLGWRWDENAQTWFYGTQIHGCGVYEENDKWYGNVSAHGSIELVGAKADKDAAMSACLERLQQLVDILGD